MRITGVKAHLLTYTLKEPFEMRFALGKRTVLKRDAMLIEVGTDEGITGWGSGDPGDMGNRSWTPATVAAQIGEGIGAVLEGENPLAIDALWNKVRSESGLDAVQLTQLFGGVDMALWDIAGKAANRPVCDILGRRRNRIRAYASAGMYMPPSGYVAEARELAAAGFTAYKMRTAMSPADDVEAAAAVRDALPGMALLVDAHSWWRAAPDIYTRDVIFGLARELDDLGLHWLEDPLDYRDTESYVDLTGSTRMRIGTGENEQGPDDHVRLVDRKACDTVIVDVRLHGGITSCIEVARHANAAGLEYAAHNFCDAISQAANAHIIMSVANPGLFELPTYACETWTGMYDNELATSLTGHDELFDSGFVSVPEQPGLGVDPVPDFKERFPYREGFWTVWTSHDGTLLAAQ